MRGLAHLSEPGLYPLICSGQVRHLLDFKKFFVRCSHFYEGKRGEGKEKKEKRKKKHAFSNMSIATCGDREYALQHTADTLQHTAHTLPTHCNTLLHNIVTFAFPFSFFSLFLFFFRPPSATLCATISAKGWTSGVMVTFPKSASPMFSSKHTATHCNTLQHIATHFSEERFSNVLK